MNKFKLKKLNCSSIYQCITPIFYLSKFFGLAPFNIPLKNKILKTSFLDFLIFLLNGTISCYLLYYVFFSNYMIAPSTTDSSVLHLCGIASILWILCIISVSIFLSLFQRQIFYDILRIVNECDDKV